MLLWGKMCAYLLSKDTFYYSASIKDKGYEKYIFWCLKVIQSHRKKIWVSTVHHVGEINCQTLKKTDSFWNNIPPGKCDPYIALMQFVTSIWIWILKLSILYKHSKVNLN